MKIEILFIEPGPARVDTRLEVMGLIERAMRWAAKGVALTHGWKISFRRY